MDARYVERLKTLLLRPSLLEGASTKIVFTNLHGTGGHINVPMLRGFGFDVLTVPSRTARTAVSRPSNHPIRRTPRR
jgi:phosphoglucomutase